jgi:preprotein translocase subunit SecB
MTDESASHPIQLEGLVFTKCLVEAIPGHVPAEQKKVSTPPENHLEATPNPEEPNQWQALMRSSINAQKDPMSPYCIEMECVAIFRTDGTLDEKTAHRAVLITAHSVLYGAIRETVSWLTGRQPYGPLLLGLSVLRPPPKQQT